MHPVMFTIPGWGFKFIVPLLVLWGMYSIVVSANRAAPAKPGAKKDGEAEPEKKGFELPADNPTNALISIAISLMIVVAIILAMAIALRMSIASPSV